MKRGLISVEANFSGGINQDVQTANFNTQCSDARNVWTPSGSVETRPGTRQTFHSAILICPFHYATAGTTNSYGVIQSSGVQTLDTAGVLNLGPLSGLLSNGMFVLAKATITKNDLTCGFRFPTMTSGNSTNARLVGGTYPPVSPYLLSLQLNSGRFVGQSYIGPIASTELWANDGTSLSQTYYCEPWVNISGATYFGWYIRGSVTGATLSIDAYPRFIRPADYTGGDGTDDNTRPTFRSSWVGYVGKHRIIGAYWFGTATTLKKLAWVVGMAGPGVTVAGTNPAISESKDALSNQEIGEPVSACSVPYERTTYLALAEGIFQVDLTNIVEAPSSPYSESETPTLNMAAVEDDPLIVGTGTTAPYAKDKVAQFDAFPKAKYISFFQNRFWFSGIEGQPSIVQWGAAAPAHRVFPSLNYEDVIENNAEEISGQAPLGPDMIIYKPSSIHRMVYTGLNSFEEATYVPQTIVNGTGCVSNASIANVNGTHVFLARGGLVQFDGEKARYIARRKVDGQYSDRLQAIWPKLAAGRWKWAVGTHWEQKHCYLLACSYNGSITNNLVIVWDYVQDAFWLWDNMDVAGWYFEDDNETVLGFMDSYGRYNRMEGGTDRPTSHDGARAITAYVKTTELTDPQASAIVVRQADVTGQSDVANMTIDWYYDGNQGDTGTLVIKDRLEPAFDSYVWDVDPMVDSKTRTRRLSTRAEGRYHQVKLSQTNLGGKLAVDTLKLQYYRTGRRGNG